MILSALDDYYEGKQIQEQKELQQFFKELKSPTSPHQFNFDDENIDEAENPTIPQPSATGLNKNQLEDDPKKQRLLEINRNLLGKMEEKKQEEFLRDEDKVFSEEDEEIHSAIQNEGGHGEM
eukprot:TRINITY_DN22782_c0_g1_i2.p4 TRINITY_DN22782_c0_g1~~TRINITY_DN22782_c0_g1_i2.p4  ORF type:complete len:122 (-),score=39.06 TRINITY_DN22782_c0_g1_i2:228-593(-)